MSDPQMALDTVYKLVEIASVLGGVVFVSVRIGRTSQRFETISAQQAKEIGELKDNVRELSKLVTSNALLDQRVVNLAERMNRIDVRMDELAHGEGYVLPLGSLGKRGSKE